LETLGRLLDHRKVGIDVTAPKIDVAANALASRHSAHSWTMSKVMSDLLLLKLAQNQTSERNGDGLELSHRHRGRCSMDRRALIAFGAVVIIAAGGAFALKAIDHDKRRAPPASSAETPSNMKPEVVTILPEVQAVPKDVPPPPPPKFTEPMMPVLRFDEPVDAPEKDLKRLSPHEPQAPSPTL
jgi:type IV secretory pathway VirB10-like protein